MPTPVTESGTGNGHARYLGGEVRLLPTTTAMDSEASGGSSPADRTLTDAVVRTELGAVENPRHLLRTPAAAEAGGGPRDRNRPGATMRLSDQIREEMEDGNILLPTPVAQPSGNTPEEHLRKKPGRTVVTDLAIIAENGLIESGGRLLPTPTASEGAHGGPGRTYGNGTPTLGGIGALLPTPSVSNSHGNEANGRGEPLLPGVVNLLPTPTVGNATGGNAQRGGARAEEKLLPGLARDHATNWGPYTAAIRQWERVLDRLAPAPVRYDGKGGKPRLNPELAEWMMGWPAGWVTAAVIGLTRSEQLKACGNGVVPRQAAMALRIMLSRAGVPRAEFGLAA